MKKTVYLVFCAVIGLAITVMSIAPVFLENQKLPRNQDEFESMAEDALDSDPVIREVYGAASRLLEPEAITVDGNPIVKVSGDYLIQFQRTVNFETDQAIENMKGLKEYCEQLGIPVYYVSYPSKSTYTDLRGEDFGATGEEKELRAEFLEGIRGIGIPVLDMEEVLKAKGFSQEEVFYKTDHHWKTRMGLIAAREIAEMLKSEAALEIHPELLEEDRFHTRVYENSWLGEIGRKVSATWTGTLDDYVLYEPDFETAFEYYVPAARISTEGSFSDFIDWDRLEDGTDLYTNSLHYAYMKDSQVVTHFRNKMLTGANILLIKDSYSVPVMPFLAIACREITWWDMRKNKDTVFAYIDKHRFDAVVIAYTDFWRDEMYGFK